MLPNGNSLYLNLHCSKFKENRYPYSEKIRLDHYLPNLSCQVLLNNPSKYLQSFEDFLSFGAQKLLILEARGSNSGRISAIISKIRADFESSFSLICQSLLRHPIFLETSLPMSASFRPQSFSLSISKPGQSSNALENIYKRNSNL